MSTSAPSTVQSTVRPRSPLSWAVLVAAVLQVVAPVVTFLGPGASPAAGSGPELIINPVGWAFAIWGVIYTLALVQAVAVLVTRTAVSSRLLVDQLVLYLAGAAWIIVAAFDTSIGTALVLAVMAVAGVDGALTVSRVGVGASALTRLSRAAVGLYAGWVTAALFLNAASAVASTGALDADEAGWQVVVLVLAAAVLLGVTVRSGGLVAYAAAGVWALFGIAVATADDGETVFVVLATVSAVVLAAAAALVLVRGGPERAR